MTQPLRWRDYLLLTAFALILFGYAAFSGTPLSLHSARLPQTSREMMVSHDWLIPRSGGRPWLERPPLPHWITIAVSAVVGQHCDQVWVVRLPAALMGVATVAMTAWIASVLFGRTIGLCSGFILATAFEFWRYATLSEDDIFLAALVVGAMAMFVRSEFVEPAASDQRVILFGTRPWPVLLFFILTGLTNLAKGPLVGAAVILAPVGMFLLTPVLRYSEEPDLSDTRPGSSEYLGTGVGVVKQHIRRYLWLWGSIAFIALTLFWPYAIYRRYPATIHNWLFDYSETSQYDEKPWYYLVQLPGVFMPWTPAVLVGLCLTARQAWRSRRSPERFLWCWAIVPLIVLSLPHRKHHHYLVPSLAPWAILGAIGVEKIAQWLFNAPEKNRRPLLGLLVFGVPIALVMILLHSKIPGPLPVTCILAGVWLVCVGVFYIGLQRRSGPLAFAAVLLGLAVAYCWGQSFLPDNTTADTAFLQQVEATVPRDEPLMINSDLGGKNGPHGEMDFFRNQFYVRADAVLLHNLSFLRDENIRAPEVFVITRASDRAKLETMGDVQIEAQSAKTRNEQSPADRFTLFRLRFRPDLMRYPAPAMDSITTMQAMGREEGPWCGPPM